MLYIPIGFGHAFAALTETVGLAYKVTYCCPAGERTILWSDPDLQIQRPLLRSAATVSDGDRKDSKLREAEVFE